jgi:hypothetical protein
VRRDFSCVYRAVLVGGFVGIVLSLVATFASALLYGQAQGMDAGSCVVFGCMFTLIMSQVTGLTGMFTGALVGALAGGAFWMLRARRLAC